MYLVRTYRSARLAVWALWEAGYELVPAREGPYWTHPGGGMPDLRAVTESGTYPHRTRVELLLVRVDVGAMAEAA